MKNENISESTIEIETLTEPPLFVLRQDLGDVRTLADDMGRHGQLSPVIARRSDGVLELIAGHRRLAAARLLEWTAIQARVLVDVSDEDGLAMAISENERRKDFSDLERALLVRRLADERRPVKEIAKLFGWGERNAHNWLSLARAEAPVWEAFASGRLGVSLAIEAAQTTLAPGLEWPEVLSAIENCAVRDARRLLDVASNAAPLWRRIASGKVSIDEAISELGRHDLRRGGAAANDTAAAPSAPVPPPPAVSPGTATVTAGAAPTEPTTIAWVAARRWGEIRCGAVASMCFLKDALLVVAETEGWISVYDIETRRAVRRLGTDALDAYPLAATRDGSLLAYPVLWPGVALWDVSSGRLRWQDATCLGPAQSMAFDLEARLLAVGHRGGVRSVWDVENGIVRRVLTGSKAKKVHVAITWRGRLVSGDSDGSLQISDAVAGRDLKQVPSRGPVGALAASATGIVAVGSGNAVTLWRGVEGSPIFLRDHTGPVCALAFAPSGRLLASAGRDRRLVLWDAVAGVELDRWKFGAPELDSPPLGPTDIDPEEAGVSVAFNCAGDLLAVGTSEGVKLFSVIVQEEPPPSRRPI